MQDLKPTVWIGKQGCTDTMIEEIVQQLKKRKMIKVKWLQNCEVDAESVAAQAKANLVEVRGRTMVLSEKGKALGTPGNLGKVTIKTPARVSVKDTAKTVVKSTAMTMAKDSGPVRSKETGKIKTAKK
jgi:RNA-binding protein